MNSTLNVNKRDLTVPQLPVWDGIFPFCLHRNKTKGKQQPKEKRQLRQKHLPVILNRRTSQYAIWNILTQGDYGVILCLLVEITLGIDGVSKKSRKFANMIYKKRSN